MKFLTVLASLVATAAAQNITIFSPTACQSLTAGQNVTVSVVRANSTTSVAEIGIGIAIRHCNTSVCADTGVLGTDLFTGAYNPQPDPATQNTPNQNFTVTIPSNIGSGNAMLSVAHAAFVGAGNSSAFLSEVANVTVIIA